MYETKLERRWPEALASNRGRVVTAGLIQSHVASQDVSIGVEEKGVKKRI
jgi:hypothetical protein